VARSARFFLEYVAPVAARFLFLPCDFLASCRTRGGMSDPSVATALQEIASLHGEIADRLGRLALSLDGPSSPRRTAVASRSADRLPTADDIALAASRQHASHFPPDSLRGHAERALIEAGGPLPLDAWADRIRAQGFHHDYNPQNPRQLEASLTALPHQTTVFVRVGRKMYDLVARAA
jgi:hypothetical protein